MEKRARLTADPERMIAFTKKSRLSPGVAIAALVG